MKRLLPTTALYILLTAAFLVASSTLTAAPAGEKTDLSAKTTLTRMPVVRMKADFEKHGNDYCNRVRREAMPYINMVCKALADTARFDAELYKSIAALESQLSAAATPARRYELWNMLYDKYSLLGLKQAYECATQCMQLAEQMGDHDRCAQARLNKAKLLTNCGFFREAAEELEAVDLSRCSKDTKVSYLVTAFNVEFEDGFYFPKRMLASNMFLERMRNYYAQTLQLVGATRGLWTT